jgi:hypothetical protein
MKQFYALTVLLAVLLSAKAQEFKTRLVFSNPAGQTDTLWVGTDAGATMGIDATLGEIDIKGTPRANFDVRASDYISSDEMYACAPYPYAPTNSYDLTNYETKTMIVPPHCSGDDYTANVFKIIIKTASLPIHVEWNSSEFTGACHDGSRLTDAYPITWWDMMYGEPHGWQELDVVNQFDYDYTACRYLTPEGDTLHILHLALVYEMAWITGVHESTGSSLKTYTNLSEHKVKFDFCNAMAERLVVELFDVSGNLVQKIPFENKPVEWQSRTGGVFFYRIFSKEKSYSGKLIL